MMSREETAKRTMFTKKVCRELHAAKFSGDRASQVLALCMRLYQTDTAELHNKVIMLSSPILYQLEISDTIKVCFMLNKQRYEGANATILHLESEAPLCNIKDFTRILSCEVPDITLDPIGT